MLSVGIADLIEIYFHKIGIMKSGAKIKHQWFKRKDIKNRLQRQITGDIHQIQNIDEILEKCKTIEQERNDIAYGSPLNDETMLKQKIDEFLKIKIRIEKNIGEQIEC